MGAEAMRVRLIPSAPTVKPARPLLPVRMMLSVGTRVRTGSQIGLLRWFPYPLPFPVYVTHLVADPDFCESMSERQSLVELRLDQHLAGLVDIPILGNMSTAKTMALRT